MSDTLTLSNPVGYRQGEVSSSVVTLADLTGGIPTAAKRAVINVETNDIRWTDDGTTPTADVGMLAKADSIFELPSTQSINGFKAIQASAGAVLNVTYYGA